MGNRYAGPSAGKRSSSKRKGSSRKRSYGGAKKGSAKGNKRTGGPRTRKGWSGPVPAKQARGSNTTAPSRGRKEPAKEEKGKKTTHAKARPAQSRGQRTAPDKRPAKSTKAPVEEEAPEPQDGAQTYEITMDENLHGPEKMEAFKSKADEMVVGERTVIHHAARYGIVRGMTWTVILSALLFWLPVAGPAVAGYVGGRKAGGPLRGIIAVLIPALVMFVIFAAVSESMDLMPTGMASGFSLDAESIADLPAQSVPLIAGLEQSINAFLATPPDVMFIMMVFAIVGGTLSSLRRREEETVIEKVGIPLGELKERILKEEADQQGTTYADPPSRWHPHRAIAGGVAAHDAFNELVEEVARKVYAYMVAAGEEPGATGTKAKGRKARRRAAQPEVSVGEDGPHFEDLVTVVKTPEGAAAAATTKKARGGGRGGGARAAVNLAPTTVAEAVVGDAGDWEVVNTSKGRRPIRVVRSPAAAGEVAVGEHDMTELEVRTAPPVVFEEEAPSPADDLPEPPMYVEETSGGIFRGIRHRVVYPTAEGGTDLGVPASPHGAVAHHDVDQVPPVRPRRNYERLPIVDSIYETMARERADDVNVTASVSSMEEPTLEDTMEASSIAGSAARELAEMARFEEGPDMVTGSVEMTPEEVLDEVGELAEALEEVLPEEEPGSAKPAEPARPARPAKPSKRGSSKPKARSTARQVKHPAGSLKSKGKRDSAEAVYEEDEALVGVVEWDGSKEDHIEQEDLFNPRRLEDGREDDGPEEGSDEWAEEERIAAIVREREDWDRL